MANSSEGQSSEVSNKSEIEQKLNLILEQQKSKTSSSTPAIVKTGGSSLVTDQEVDNLKAEIYNLRQQLKDAENNSVNNKKASNAGLSDEVSSNETEPINSVEMTKASEAMVVKVKELESRLAEYEIIADDIAELSQLRADNAKLKEQLLKAQSENTTTPNLDSQLEDSQSTQAQPIKEATPVEASKETSEDSSGQAMVDALFAEANADVAQSESAVPEGDKNLLNEFEKISQKKGNE